MGGKKQKTEQQQATTQTIQLPQWMTDAGQGLYQDAKKTADANPVQAYGGQMSPGMASNQQAANTLAAQSVGAGQGDLNDARRMTAAAAGGAVPQVTADMWGADQAQRYMNPYTSAVQQRTLDEMGRRNQMEQQSVGDSAQAARAFGGTRHALMQSELAKNQNANMLDFLASSNADAYNNANAMFQSDRAASMGAQSTNAANQQGVLNRMLQAGGQAANIGGQARDLSNQDIMTLLQTGGIDQATAGDQLQSQYGEFLRMQDAPMERYRDLTAILSGQPRNVTTNGTMTGTSVTKTGGGFLNTLLGLGQLGVAAFSDRRLKRSIERLGELANGLGVYRFRYLWERPDVSHTGVMADEVERIQPEALGPVVHGFRTVNYGALAW